VSPRPFCTILLALVAACRSKEAAAPDAARRPEPAPVDLSRVERIPSEGSAFGTAVAVDGDTLVVGAPGPLGGHDAGAVIVYQRTPAGWSKSAQLGAAGSERLGRALAISGDLIVAGARGAAFVFARGANGWTPATRLSASDASETLGEHVAIAGDTIAVGEERADMGEVREAGMVRLYHRGAGGFSEEARLAASPPRWSETFGSDLALAGSTIAVGARQAKSDAGVDAVGALHVFELQVRGWVETFSFAPPGTPSFATLGHSIALDGDIVLAGSQGLERAFAFERRGGHWQAIGTLDAPAMPPGRYNFCATLAVRGDVAAIGSIPLSADSSIPLVPGTNRLDDNALAARHGPRGGTVFVYQLGPDGWRQVTALEHPLTQAGDGFGRALAFGHGLLVVGAPGIGEVVVFSATLDRSISDRRPDAAVVPRSR
jgi:FG-GAP repeat